MSKVQIIPHPETNEIITVSANNPDYGTVRVDAQTGTFTNGFYNVSRRTAFIRGTVENLQMLVKSANAGWLSGKIQVLESTKPFYEGQDPKVNPSNGEVLTVGNAPIYRQSVFTTDVNATDTLLQHDTVNVEVATPAEAIAGHN